MAKLTEIDGTFFDENGNEVKPEKGEKKGRKKTKVENLSYEECQQKLTRVFNGICTILKVNKRYSESDFIEEAKDLERLSKKYQPIAMILTILDPLFFVLGIIDKISEIAKQKRKEPAKNEKQDAKNSVNQVSTDIEGGRIINGPFARNFSQSN